MRSACASVDFYQTKMLELIFSDGSYILQFHVKNEREVKNLSMQNMADGILTSSPEASLSRLKRACMWMHEHVYVSACVGALKLFWRPSVCVFISRSSSSRMCMNVCWFIQVK